MELSLSAYPEILIWGAGSRVEKPGVPGGFSGDTETPLWQVSWSGLDDQALSQQSCVGSRGVWLRTQHPVGLFQPGGGTVVAPPSQTHTAGVGRQVEEEKPPHNGEGGCQLRWVTPLTISRQVARTRLGAPRGLEALESGPCVSGDSRCRCLFLWSS